MLINVIAIFYIVKMIHFIVQTLFMSLYKSFTDVLAEPLKETDGNLYPSGETVEMAVDNDDSSAMELEEGGRSQKRCISCRYCLGEVVMTL